MKLYPCEKLFSGTIVQLKLMKTSYGWDICLFMSKTLRNDDHVFECCRRGDVAAVRRLFQTGNLTPSVVDHNGFGLIEATISGLAIQWASDESYMFETSRQIELIRLLLEYGAKLSEGEFGLKLAGPSPQSQYTEEPSHPLILGSVALGLIELIGSRHYEGLTIPENLEVHLWYYLYFALEASILQKVEVPIQVKDLSSPKLSCNPNCNFHMPGAFEPLDFEPVQTPQSQDSAAFPRPSRKSDTSVDKNYQLSTQTTPSTSTVHTQRRFFCRMSL
jgi:hypothetical protein